jgi:transposase, IS5 family
VPADIRYPNDLGLLNQAREQTERTIDRLYKRIEEKAKKKPRTYRNKARKEYLLVAKKRKITRNDRRKAVKKQLQYIRRNLETIEKIVNEVGLEALSRKEYRLSLVVAEVNRQQLYMYESNENRIDDRIVSLTQPHVRPIVRGKSGTPVEFGAKLSASCVSGYVFLDRISWDNFNESGDLINQVEEFKQYTGAYPESVHADKIYRTKLNRSWCKEKGIRLSGVKLGRPPKTISKEAKKQARLDEAVRNCIEGKLRMKSRRGFLGVRFTKHGEGKRRFSLDRIMTKLANTSETAIAISFLVMNLSALLRQFFVFFYEGFKSQHSPAILMLL